MYSQGRQTCMSRIERNTSGEALSTRSGRVPAEQAEHERAVLRSLLRVIGEHEPIDGSERLLGALAVALGQAAGALRGAARERAHAGGRVVCADA